MTKQYRVAGLDLYFPDDHLLDQYQSIWHLYDRALGLITKEISTKYPEMTAIDIGANVGDSAALIQEFQTVPTLCIEGNPEYLGYLEENAKIIGNVEIADCFIGEENTSVTLDAITSHGGTTSILNALDVEGVLVSQMISLESLLNYYPRFRNAKLLKIDTDGYDFNILKNSQKFIKNSHPIIYFEYDISFDKNSHEEGLLMIEILTQLNYKKFAIYDNFGNHMINLDAQDRQYFNDLTNYLFSNHHKSGRKIVHYFDICACPAVDLDIFEQLYSASNYFS